MLEAEGGARKLTILATGSELHLAVEARPKMQDRRADSGGVDAVRRPFDQQDAAYRRAVLGETRAARGRGGGGDVLGPVSGVGGPLCRDTRIWRLGEDR